MKTLLQTACVAISLLCAPILAAPAPASAQNIPPEAKEADALFKNFVFKNGAKLPQLKIHYTTLGTPKRGKDGQINNAVLILHGTGGTGHQFFQPQFAGELFGSGQILDTAKYFIILPDNIGHGKSSKPSDGMRMAFPAYDYTDMVAAQRMLVSKTLGIKRLKLILGTSMGCMHIFEWATTYKKPADKLAPFACLPTEIAGQNRMWRKLTIDAIKNDPAWQGGNYSADAQPLSGLRTAASMSMIAGANPLGLQTTYPTRAAAEEYLEGVIIRNMGRNDANDVIYQMDSSRNYNPLPLLEKIDTPMLWINSADDFINPYNLGIAETATPRIAKAQFILIPASADTKGHGTHTWAKFWKDDLAKFLAE
jgi:homoserine O-acetyltransferase/O-succinyltransferase